MPNHVRAWRRDAYRRIGGHDAALPVADDYELLVRTFLHGRMARIPRPLYVQHHAIDGSNASRRQNAEILRRVAAVAARHADALDARCLSLAAPRAADAPTGAEPISAASACVDVLAEAAEDAGEPLVSVVVPTYRRPGPLARAVESALGQRYARLEVLVVGDGCPDVDAVVDAIDDPRVRHANLAEHHGDGGAAPRNQALKLMARGTLVAYLDDDNAWHPEHVDSLVTLLTAEPAATFAFSSIEVAGETIVCRRPRRYLIDTSALLHRRFLLERFGYWRPVADADYAHDWELVSRWAGEPWVASLRATARYDLDSSAQDGRVLEAMRAAAEQERVRAERR